MFHLVTIILLLFFVSDPLGAATLTVGPGQPYLTIGTGINAAVSGDIVQVYPNPPNHYPENIVLKSGVTVEGVEAGATKIVGIGSGAVVTMTSGASIINMTIGNASSTGIYISGVTGTNITNNLIVGNLTGINCSSSSNLTITNNVVDGGGTGVVCSGAILNMIFENNIVSNNSTGINFSGVSSGISSNYNDIYNNGSNVYMFGPNDLLGSPNPIFVAPQINDYHLQTGSPCIDGGDPAPQYNDKEVSITLIDHTRNDCGAYGGPQRDTTPFQIQHVVATPGTNSITLSWNANLAYDIAAYNIFFDNQIHTMTNDIPYPLYNNSVNVSPTSANCSFTPVPPSCTVSLTLPAPNNLQVGFGDQELFFNWAAPSGFILTTGYNLYFEATTASQWTTVPVGNVTSYTLSGLTNGVVYNAYVTAVSLPGYFINITSLDSYTLPIRVIF